MKLKFVMYGHEGASRDFIEGVEVFNSRKVLLGHIVFSSDWKCWVWQQGEYIDMAGGCLQQVVDKIGELDKK